MAHDNPDIPLEVLARRFQRFAEREAEPAFSPLYARLCRGIAADPQVLALAAAAPPGQPAPNLLLGAVHYLLLGGADHPLAAFYPSLTSSPDPRDAYPAFQHFCLEHAADIRELLLTRRVQTNEVARCACLLPAFALVARQRPGASLSLIEIGASAGLNLLWDCYGYDYFSIPSAGRHSVLHTPRQLWKSIPANARKVNEPCTIGNRDQYGVPASPLQIPCVLRGGFLPPLPSRLPEVAFRVGVDLNPVDTRAPDAVLWLRALIWPEHHERVSRLQQAREIAKTHRPEVLAGDALSLLPEIVAQAPLNTMLCIFHSLTTYQFSAEQRERLTSLLLELSARRAIFRISFEHLAGADHPQLRLFSYTDGITTEQVLANCSAHGRWLEWLA